MTEWHDYSHGGQGRVVAVLALISVAIAAAWNWLSTAAVLSIPWWLDTPAVLGFYGILYAAFDRWAWKWLRPLHGVSDYSGNYEVTIKSSYDGHSRELTGTITICQRWSKLVVRLKTVGSGSVSKAGYLVETPGEGHRVVYLYHNKPKEGATETMQQHDGTADLLFSADGKSATGSYYTGRGRLSHGKLELQKISV